MKFPVEVRATSHLQVTADCLADRKHPGGLSLLVSDEAHLGSSGLWAPQALAWTLSAFLGKTGTE